MEKWSAVNRSLVIRCRGLPGGSSLGQLLTKHRGARNRGSLPKLSREHILAWADAHHRKTGAWPIAASGPIEGAGGETWRTVDQALRRGHRGLPKASLAQLLAKCRGVPNSKALPPLSVEQILVWADAHRKRSGKYPHALSGRIQGASLTWLTIDRALNGGYRGLPGGTSLARLLVEHRLGIAETVIRMCKLVERWGGARRELSPKPGSEPG